MNLYPGTDIVVLNYNGKKFLKECFESLLQSGYPNQTVYLLDNNSTDDDVAYTIREFPWVKIIRNPENNGYCAAYNLALRETSSPYFLCLNNDVKVKPGFLEPMVRLMEENRNIAAVQPKLLSYFQPDTFEYAGASGGMIDRFGFPFMRGRIFDSVEIDNGQYNSQIPVFWASGAALLLRREALISIGVFDETIVHHMDEIDLCWRLILGGYTVNVCPQSEILHIGGGTITTRSFKKTYWNHRNSLYVMLKNYEAANLLKYVPVHILLDYVFILKSLLSGDFIPLKAILKAHIWLLLNLNLILKKRNEVKRRRKVSDKVLFRFMYPGSIVVDYFIRHKTLFSQLNPFGYGNKPGN